MSLTVDNLAFVRVVDGLPVIDETDNVVLKPVGDSCTLQYLGTVGNRLGLAIFELIKKYDKLEDLVASDYDNEYLLKLKLERNRVRRESYLPLIGVTNRFQNFSVNGIVPDDMNNCFSTKKIAVIDLVKFHLNDNLIGLNANDCTIKGDFPLSSKGIILISNDVVHQFDSDFLMQLQTRCKVIFFDGPIKDSIKIAVEFLGCPFSEIGKYGFVNDYGEYTEKEENLQMLLKSLCIEYEVSSLRNLKLLDLPTENKEMHIVYKYYANKFFEYLFEISNGQIYVDEDMRSYFMGQDVMIGKNNRFQGARFVQMIEDYCLENGKVNIDKYKLLVAQYNQRLQELSRSGNLPTANQIIDEYGTSKKSL